MARVMLTVVATVGMAARAQQSSDPCALATFSPSVCKTAVRHHGYCSGGAWIPATYQQSYPNYYDSYQSYLAGGGQVTPMLEEDCRRPHGFFSAHGISHGGFGSTGRGHHAGG